MEQKTPINPVWTTEELLKDFEVIEFRAPFVLVIRKLDGQKGTMQFRTTPREYFDFIPDD